MEEKAKEIISLFLKVPPAQINSGTAIDRSAVNSSILLHRMYGKLADAGIVVNNYQNLRYFGELQQQLNGKTAAVASAADGAGIAISQSTTPNNTSNTTHAGNPGIGIDIEMVSAMPLTDDFREDKFYSMNFSAEEMAYCILQPSPYASFAGLFAAKEAIVKADNQYKGKEFKDIIIQRLAGGKPFHPAFTISISHTPEIAVAVAVPLQKTVQPVNSSVSPPAASSPSVTYWWLLLLSLLLSLTAIFMIARKD